MFDIIGDIHGHASPLKKLLLKLGYKKNGNNFSHPTRKVCFLGDLIDRGDEILETLAIVREMMNNGNAYCIMGNHEYNYLAYHLFSQQQRDFCRPHTFQHNKQIAKTLSAFNELSSSKKKEWQKWFYDLPLYLEFSNFRLAHAFWHQPSLKIIQNLSCIKNGSHLTPEAIIATNHFVDKKKSLPKQALEIILKGPEYPLKKEFYFYDRENNLREYARIFWWKIPMNGCPNKNILLKDILHLPKTKKYQQEFNSSFKDTNKTHLLIYPLTEKPLFFGHYWLKIKNKPQVLQTNATSLDYSIAHHGNLVAYRYDNERELSVNKFVWV